MTSITIHDSRVVNATPGDFPFIYLLFEHPAYQKFAVLMDCSPSTIIFRVQAKKNSDQIGVFNIYKSCQLCSKVLKY